MLFKNVIRKCYSKMLFVHAKVGQIQARRLCRRSLLQRLGHDIHVSGTLLAKPAHRADSGPSGNVRGGENTPTMHQPIH